MAKPKAVLLGGKGFNVPKQLHRHFDLVKHFEQDKSDKIQSIPQCDIILVIRDWVHHGAILQAAKLAPGTPIVASRAGWSHMYTELERRRLLPPPEPEPVASAEPEQTLLGLPGAHERVEASWEPEIPEVAKVPEPAPEPEPEPAPEPPAPPPPPPDRLEVLVDLLSMSKGEITPEVRELYRQQFPDDPRISGPVAAAARRRLGFAEPKEPQGVERVMSDNPILRESMLLYANVEKLVDRRNELLAQKERVQKEIDAVDGELEVYKPIIQHFEQLKMVSQRVKTAIEKKAMKEREKGPVSTFTS